MNSIVPSQGLAELAPISPAPAAPKNGGGFAQVLEQVGDLLARADQMASGYAQGKVGLTEAVVASTKADTEFAAVMAVRNRALAAYQEIMNLQV